MKKAITIMTLILASGFYSAFAQYRYNKADGYLGLRTGFIELEDVDDEGSFNLGLVGGYFLNDYFSLEASVDWQKSDVILDFGDVIFNVPFLERKTTALQLGLKFHPAQRGRLRPFLTAGVGYYWSEYVDDFIIIGGKRADYYDDYYYDDRVDDGGYYAGGGFDLFGRGNRARGFGLTWDIRWLYTQDEENDRELHAYAEGWTSTLAFKFKF